MSLPAKTHIVIIGGGIIGCSIAYHLTKRGVRDVVLLERLQLTHGATWHAAGLVGQLRSSSNLTRLMRYGAELYGTLEAETGQATGWHRSGSLRLASSSARWQELRRSATMARGFDFHVDLISAREAQGLFPLIETSGVVGAAWIEGDGYADPTSLTNAYATGARQGGATLIQGVRVTADSNAAPAGHHGCHRRRRDRRRMRDQRRRHVGRRDRGTGWHARAGGCRRASIPGHRKDGAHSPRIAVAARSGWQFLREARNRCTRGGRLGIEHAAMGRERDRAGFRTGIAGARLRALCAAGRGRHRAHSDPRRTRHSADDQWPDSHHRRRRAGDRPLAGPRQFLPLLRLHGGHRGIRRRRLGDGELDRRWGPGPRPVAVRRSTLRRAAFGQAIHVRAGRGKLRPVLPHRMAELRSRRRTRRAPQSVACDARGCGRRLRQQVRLGTPQLVRAARYTGDRDANVRTRACIRCDRCRAPRGARAGGADRHDVVFEVRGARPGRAGDAAAAGGERPRPRPSAPSSTRSSATSAAASRRT